jgi:mediator of RNA polymerase II transcription subunit 17, fungi type
VEESSLAQDFISLLLSSMRPAAGSASMSPALRNAVPTGALGGGRIAAPPQKADTVLCAGWRKSELDKASQTLIAAAERVGRKQGAITGFVEGVSKVRSGGWGIVQMPAPSGETGGFKVFYGFQKGMEVSRLVLTCSRIRLS